MNTAKSLSAIIDKEFAVFLIGMQLNKWWKIGSIIQAAKDMGRVLKKLYSSGFIAFRIWFRRTTIMVQNWEEKSELSSKDRNNPSRIDYYGNTPPFLLGKFFGTKTVSNVNK